MVNYTTQLIKDIRAKTRRYGGFTLAELLLALVIVGILATIAANSYSEYIDRVKITQAKSDILLIESVIERFYTVNFRYPESLSELTGQIPLLDPWKNPYQYLNITTTKGKGKVRKDHNLVPLNTDYDLYSMGKDGQSVSPLTAKASRDDIVRANNGGFIGLASEY
ncbi:MAG: prepilin-type N-terminal cleavage/methylation domain-containing protein [Candidatus Competibacteraceae bacterium]